MYVKAVLYSMGDVRLGDTLDSVGNVEVMTEI